MSEELNQVPRVARGYCELTIAATPQRVWTAMVEKTDAWWLKDFYTRPNATFRIEAKLDGRMFEDQGNGCGLIWGKVIGVDPENALDIQTYLTPDFGGPALSFLNIRLKAIDGNTLLSVSDTIFGFPGEKTAGNCEEGWRMLFNGLKDFVEA